MEPTWVKILCAVLGSGVLASFLPKIWDAIAQHRRNKKNKPDATQKALMAVNEKLDNLINRIDQLEEKEAEIERNEIRTQLMVLFCDYKEKSDEIFTVARKYFVELNGNSYIKNLFEDWCERNEETLPDWYIEKFGTK